MGVIPLNEQYVEQMAEILDILYQYIPEQDDGKLMQIAMGGDQLTVARCRTAQEVRVTATSIKHALRGMQFFAADWHGRVNFMEVFPFTYYTFYYTFITDHLESALKHTVRCE
jgi:hypothetical protein